MSHENDDAISLADVPFPRVDFNMDNPIPAIMQSSEYRRAAELFPKYPFGTDPLISWYALSLLYATIRNQHPNCIAEVGSYKGGTSRVMAQALDSNCKGTLHTIGPFDSHHFLPNYEKWPKQIKARTTFHPVSSMDFFIKAEAQRLQFDLVFIDGNHDYEFALYDILSAARRMTPGGFIFVDNISQAGPYFAAIDFLALHPHWLRCDGPGPDKPPHLAYDRARTSIAPVDFIILRAPRIFAVGARPHTFGPLPWPSQQVAGVRLPTVNVESAGTLWVQCVLRGFGQTHLAEVTTAASATVAAGSSCVEVPFAPALSIAEPFSHYSVETWFTWTGGGILKMTEPPVCY